MFESMSGRDSPMGSIMGPSNMNMEIGESMFETLGRPPRLGPSADQMADAMKKLQVHRKVTLKDVKVRTYDLGNQAECEAYQKDLQTILMGVPAKTHVILAKPPPQFVSEGGKPRYIAHMQWIEFELNERPAPTTASVRKEMNHGKATISD